MELLRVFIGGLPRHILEDELKSRFSKYGNISTVEVKNKTDPTGEWLKTFAYLDITMTQQAFQKCRSQLNNTTWRDGKITIQLAKQDTSNKYAEERKSRTEATRNTPSTDLVNTIPTVKKGAVPGTLLPENENWVVTKYQRVVPVMNIRSKDKKKLIRYDPSKHCHQIKTLDNERNDKQSNEKLNVSALTWTLDDQDESSGVSDKSYKQKMGDFTDLVTSTKPRKGRTAAEVITEENERRKQAVRDDDMEVVSSSTVISAPILASKDRVSTSMVSEELCESVVSNTNVDLSRFDSDSDNDAEPTFKTINSLYDTISTASSEKLPDRKSSSKNKRASSSKAPSPKKVARRAFPGTAAFNDSPNSEKVIGKAVNSIRKNRASTSSSSSESDDSDTEMSNPPSSKVNGSSSRLNGLDKNRTESISHSSTSESDSSDSSDELSPQQPSSNKIADHTQLETKVPTSIKSKKIGNTGQKTEKSNSTVNSATPSVDRNAPQELLNQTNNISTPNFASLLQSAVQSAGVGQSTNSPLALNLGGLAPVLGNISNESGAPSANALALLLESAANIIRSATKTNQQSSDSQEMLVINPSTDPTPCNRVTQPVFSDESSPISKQPSKRKRSSNDKSASEATNKSNKEPISKLVKQTTRRSSSTSESSSDSDSDSDQKPSPKSRQGQSKVVKKHEYMDNRDSSSLGKEKAKVEPPTDNTTHYKPQSKIDTTESSSSDESSDSSSDSKTSKTNNIKPKVSGVTTTNPQPKTKKAFVSVTEKRALANQKRLEALANKQKELKNQQSTISQSLSNIDGATNNKKIVFDSDSEAEESSSAPKMTKSSAEPTKSTKILFGDSDDNEEDYDKMFAIKPQFEGEKGAKLLNLQKSFNDDDRFKLTEKFLEPDSDKSDSDPVADDRAELSEGEHDMDVAEERRRNLEILQSIVGSKNVKIDHPTSSSGSKAKKLADTPATVFRDVSSIHFDPTSESHSQLVKPVTVSSEPKKSKKKSKKLEGSDPVVGSEPAPEVDKSRFFEVASDFRSGTISKSTDGKGMTFGFFNEDEEPAERTGVKFNFANDESDDDKTENDGSRKKYQNPLDPSNNTMKFDDESEESGSDEEELKEADASDMKKPGSSSAQETIANTVVDWFFFKKDDPRLIDGAKRFAKSLDEIVLRKKWEQIRPKLVENYMLKSKRATKKSKSTKTSIIKKRSVEKAVKSRAKHYNY